MIYKKKNRDMNWYELEQSYDNNVNLLKENKNILTSFTNDKFNGKNVDNMNKYDLMLSKIS